MYTNPSALVALEIKNMKRAIEIINMCIPVIKKFDGKVVNKRLTTALSEATGGEIINVHKDSYRFLSWYSRDRYIQGEHCCEYISSSTYMLTECIKDAVNESGRLNADAVIEAMHKQNTTYETRIKEFTDAEPTVESAKAQIKELKKQIESIINGIPYVIRDYYDVRR